MCTPFFTTSSCVLISTPPMQSKCLISGYPASLSGIRNCSITSYVCFASSRDGQMIIPNGPSPGTIGIMISSCSATMMSGSTNTSVFPDPVKAMPIMSRPESTTGSPCTWMGVGWTMPLSRSLRRMGSGRRRSRKSRAGGGTSSPSTMMCHLRRSSSALARGMRRRRRGGFQPVSSGSL
uniref:ATP-dependent RNA helicase DDX41 n=1 Tax=Arundo donax TaxID=35708 RepID=A0A0A8YW84_ARUDO